MPNKPMGLVIVGLGGMGSQHATMLKPVTEIQVLGSFDTDPARSSYASFDAVLADPAVNAILIATPNDSHKDYAIKAMKSGKHVICEKPVTLGSQELREILAVAQETGKVFMVHQNRRWDEDFLSMKKLYNDGSLGTVYHIETRVQGSRGIPGDWRKVPQNGGGMMLDWGVHLIDRLLTMVPERVTSVYCRMHFPTWQPSDEGFHLFLTFVSGRTALVEVNTCNYITLPKWYMLGTTGSAVIEDWLMNGKVVKLRTRDEMDAKPIVAGAGLTKTMAPRLDDSVYDEALPRIEADVRDFYRNFVKVTEGKAAPVVKNTEVLRVMRLIEAAFESHRTGQAVAFE